MSSSKYFVQNHFKKWKQAASQFISNESDDESLDESSVIELEPEYYEKCRQIAEARHTTVAAVVHYMLKQQLALHGKERTIKGNIEQLESNPLLALDGLTGRKRNWEPEAAEDEFA